MIVSQDGKDFYDESSGELIYTSKISVIPLDMDAAREARLEFIKWFDKRYPGERLIWLGTE